MNLENAARTVLDALAQTGVSHMLVGGLSSNYYGIARSTKDVDVMERYEAVKAKVPVI